MSSSEHVRVHWTPSTHWTSTTAASPSSPIRVSVCLPSTSTSVPPHLNSSSLGQSSTGLRALFSSSIGRVRKALTWLSEPIYLAGDLNIHLERSDDTYTTRLVDLPDTYRLDIRVSESTHELGGILDVVVSCRELTAPVVDVADVGLSDNFVLQWSVTSVTTASRRRSSRRSSDARGARWTSPSSDQRCRRQLSVNPTTGEVWTSTRWRRYDVEMTALLDRVIPARTITRRPRPSDPWFDAECRAAETHTPTRAHRRQKIEPVCRKWRCKLQSLVRMCTSFGELFLKRHKIVPEFRAA